MIELRTAITESKPAVQQAGLSRKQEVHSDQAERHDVSWRVGSGYGAQRQMLTWAHFPDGNNSTTPQLPPASAMHVCLWRRNRTSAASTEGVRRWSYAQHTIASTPVAASWPAWRTGPSPPPSAAAAASSRPGVKKLTIGDSDARAVLRMPSTTSRGSVPQKRATSARTLRHTACWALAASFTPQRTAPDHRACCAPALMRSRRACGTALSAACCACCACCATVDVGVPEEQAQSSSSAAPEGEVVGESPGSRRSALVCLDNAGPLGASGLCCRLGI